MDVLALVCNLYADGPATLHRLRRAGLDARERLEATSAEALAELLTSSVSVAERFKREMRRLYDRVDEKGCGSADGEFAEAEEAVGGQDPLMERALERWRAWDEEDRAALQAIASMPVPERAPERTPAPEVDTAVAPAETPAPEGNGAASRNGAEGARPAGASDESNVEEEEPVEDGHEYEEPEPGDLPLGAVGIAGLEVPHLARLRDGGVQTVNDLLERDAAELSLQLGLPLRRLMRWQLLAREIEREADQGEEEEFQLPRPGPGSSAAVAALPSGQVEYGQKFSPACAPGAPEVDVLESEPRDLDSAGPFA